MRMSAKKKNPPPNQKNAKKSHAKTNHMLNTPCHS